MVVRGGNGHGGCLKRAPISFLGFSDLAQRSKGVMDFDHKVSDHESYGLCLPTILYLPYPFLLGSHVPLRMF